MPRGIAWNAHCPVMQMATVVEGDSMQQPPARPASPTPEERDRDIDLTQRTSAEQAKLPHERDQSPDAQKPADDPVDQQKSERAQDDARKGRQDTGLKPVAGNIAERQDREAGKS